MDMCIDFVLNLKNKQPGGLAGEGGGLCYDKLSAKKNEYYRPVGTQPSSPSVGLCTTSLACVCVCITKNLN